jgi:hypothetical protein
MDSVSLEPSLVGSDEDMAVEMIISSPSPSSSEYADTDGHAKCRELIQTVYLRSLKFTFLLLILLSIQTWRN